MEVFIIFDYKIKSESRYKLLYIDEYTKIYYHKGKLIIKQEQITNYLSLPDSYVCRLISKIKLLAKIFRVIPRYVIKFGESYIIAYHGQLIEFNRSGEIINVIQFKNGMNAPLNLIYVNKCSDLEDCIIFGDYFSNAEKSEVNVYKYKNKKITVIGTFPKNTVTHIHNLIINEKKDEIYILTGDSNAESGIWKYVHNKKIEAIVVGEQIYRSCVAFIDGESLIYATDTPLESNKIISLNLDSKKVTVLADINGPCIFGNTIKIKEKEYYIFVTTVEPNPNINPLRYILTRKKAIGVIDYYSHVYIGKNNLGFYDLLKIKKDCLPITLFQFGNMNVLSYKNTLYVMPMSLKTKKKTIGIQIEMENKYD